ncbi:hypothetical protein CHS0354_013480 [Potamilus streckersoni]|uniref:Centromere protein N n=1 Tax=Potamilus streckersoni TaxID=2493646 RepID=A0AAE0W869_9BIVA|nr:hypothetical protein CHS0354_013480 [Potamilus streckersoni]
MEVDILKRCFGKCKTSDIFSVLKKWSFLSSADISHLESAETIKGPKRNLVGLIADICSRRDNFNIESVGELDLICVQMNPSKCIWSCYQLEESNDEDEAFDPVQLKQKLGKHLRLCFDPKSSVSTVLHNGAVWMKLYIPQQRNQKYQAPRSVYLIHYLHTPLILMTGLKASIKEFLFQALLNCFNCKKLLEMKLTGRQVDSLKELALNRWCQGDFSKFRYEQVQRRPLSEILPRKRKVDESEEELDPNITCENEGMKKRRKEMLDKVFGTNTQPVLEKLDFKVRVRYKDAKNFGIADPDVPFTCEVKFEGPSVIEGIRNLGRCGMAKLPLPPHLTRITSLAKNHFVLTDKGELDSKHKSK